MPDETLRPVVVDTPNHNLGARPMDPSIGEASADIETASRALVRHALNGNLGALRALDAAHAALDERTRVAGIALHRHGYAYAILGATLGLTARQASARFGAAPDDPLLGVEDRRPDRRTPEGRIDQLVDALRQLGGSGKTVDVAARIGLKPSATRQHLRHAVAAGRVMQIPAPPSHYATWCLVDNQSEAAS